MFLNDEEKSINEHIEERFERFVAPAGCGSSARAGHTHKAAPAGRAAASRVADFYLSRDPGTLQQGLQKATKLGVWVYGLRWKAIAPEDSGFTVFAR